MAKRKISGIINATEHPMNLETPWNQKQPDGTYHAYAGDDIEAFLKKELSNRTSKYQLILPYLTQLYNIIFCIFTI